MRRTQDQPKWWLKFSFIRKYHKKRLARDRKKMPLYGKAIRKNLAFDALFMKKKWPWMPFEVDKVP